MATRRVPAELSAKRREAGRRGAAARWGNGKPVTNNGSTQPKRPSVHRRRLDDYAARIVDRAAANRLAPSDLRDVRLPWYSIVDQAEAEATVFIYDEIGGSFGVDAQAFAEELAEVTAPVINVRINSPGGGVFDGIAIYNSLLAHEARVIVWVDALAASIASVIAMAGDEVVMTHGSQMMIHDALGIEMGNAADMARMSTFLDRQSDNLADIYAARAGGEPGEWRERMLAETWMFGKEAVELGLADRVAERRPDPDGPDPAEDDVDAELRDLMSRSFNVAARYRYGGRDDAPAPTLLVNRATRPAARRREGPTVDDPPAPPVDTVDAETLRQLDAMHMDLMEAEL